MGFANNVWSHSIRLKIVAKFKIVRLIMSTSVWLAHADITSLMKAPANRWAKDALDITEEYAETAVKDLGSKEITVKLKDVSRPMALYVNNATKNFYWRMEFAKWRTAFHGKIALAKSAKRDTITMRENASRRRRSWVNDEMI